MRILVAAGLSLAAAVLSPMVTSSARASTSHDPRLGQSTPAYNAAGHGYRSKPKPKPVTLKAEAGYDGNYRDTYRNSVWIPVRVAITNHTQQDVTGRIEIPQSGQVNNGPPQPYRGLYDMPVTLPSMSTKHVTLYVPSTSNNGELHVRFIGTGHITASTWAYPTDLGMSNLMVGALAGDPRDISWLQNINVPITFDFARLTPATLDPVPEALANFDIIVFTDVDTSRLDAEQFSALHQYVRNGGTLLLVGGPNWQETLHPLPSWLVPGTLSGSVTVADLSGLSTVASAASLPHARTTLSQLFHVRGAIVARQGSTPLIVQDQLGSGTIEYLAFDPAVRPVDGWSHRGAFLGRILSQAAAPAVGRAAAQSGGPSGGPFYVNGYGGNIATELANIPSAALPSLLLFVALTILYIILLGPANYLVLRRLRRLELSWISIPLLGVVCVGFTFGVAYRLKGSTVVVNTISFVPLDGSGSSRASMYVGLFAPVRGDYQLNFDGPALPAMVPSYDYYGPSTQPRSLGLRFDEGAGTNVSLLSMNMWSSRAVALDTTLHVPGTVQSDLRVDRHGNIVGTIRNGTNLLLRSPAIRAGKVVKHLPNIPSGASMRVRVTPNGDIFGQDPGIGRLYGTPNYRYSQSYNGGGAVIPFFPNQGPCCPGPALPQEKTFGDRVRNAIVSLPEASTILSMGEVVLVAWSDAPLGRLTVDGSAPHRRDLTMLAAPLSVHLPSGPFHLRSGTIGARLVDIVPAMPVLNMCCGPQGVGLAIGPGGSATFRFDIPRAHTVHFRKLTLWVNAGGADGENLGRVYDWQARRWRTVDLSFASADLHDPDRFVSSAGELLVKLAAAKSDQDFRIMNPYQNLQLVGSGVAS